MTALASGPVTVGLVHRLRAAESSKNLMLLEAVRRKLAQRKRPHRSTHTETEELERALGRLERLQRDSPDLLRAVLGLPHLGAWAYRSLEAANAGRRVDTAYLSHLVHGVLRSGDPGELTNAPALSISHENQVLRVAIDSADPYLDLYGPRAEPPSSEKIETWRARLTGAWRLIVTHDVLLAEAMAASLALVVPLRDGQRGRPRSATSGWAFGAIGMSLPPDDLWCADTLVHEFRHLLLGAVLDHYPLLRPGVTDLAYSPWREDPRPPLGLLFGSHAYVGLLAFWRRLGDRRASLKIGRWLEPTAEVTETLNTLGALSRQGQLLVTPMRRALAEWCAEEKDTRPNRHAEDAAADHHLRWRLRHLRLDGSALDALANNALPHGRSPGAGPARPAAAPLHSLPSTARSELLELESGGRAIHPLPSPDTAAKAVLAGDYDSAAAEYKARIDSQGDLDAWAGLALCRRRTAPASALANRPELVVALYERLHTDGHGRVDPDLLAVWLDKRHVIIGSMSSETLPR